MGVWIVDWETLTMMGLGEVTLTMEMRVWLGRVYRMGASWVFWRKSTGLGWGVRDEGPRMFCRYLFHLARYLCMVFLSDVRF